MRNKYLKIRCTEDERDLIMSSFKSSGHASFSDWFRSFAYEYAKAGDEKDTICQGLAGVKIELQRIGNNLNQLTRSHNSGQSVDVSDDLKEIRETILTISSVMADMRPTPYIMEKKDHDR